VRLPAHILEVRVGLGEIEQHVTEIFAHSGFAEFQRLPERRVIGTGRLKSAKTVWDGAEPREGVMKPFRDAAEESEAGAGWPLSTAAGRSKGARNSQDRDCVFNHTANLRLGVLTLLLHTSARSTLAPDDTLRDVITPSRDISFGRTRYSSALLEVSSALLKLCKAAFGFFHQSGNHRIRIPGVTATVSRDPAKISCRVDTAARSVRGSPRLDDRCPPARIRRSAT